MCVLVIVIIVQKIFNTCKTLSLVLILGNNLPVLSSIHRSLRRVYSCVCEGSILESVLHCTCSYTSMRVCIRAVSDSIMRYSGS